MKNNSDLGRCLRRALRVLALTALPAFLLSPERRGAGCGETGECEHRRTEVGTIRVRRASRIVNSDKDTRPYDKHDFNGFWARNPSAQYGQPACPECRDIPGPSYGYFGDVPPMTPAGQKRFEANTAHEGLCGREPNKLGT